jgi:biopolymer transport protein ExbD
MTYHPPIHVGFIEGSLLPPSQVALAKPKDKTNKDLPPKDKEPPATDKEPAATDVLMVTVHTVRKGQTEEDRENGDPSSVEIKRPESTKAIILSGDSTLPRDKFIQDLRGELERELKRILNEPGNKKLREDGKTELKLEVDGDLKHRYWMSFYDTCKMSGFQSIYFVAPAPEVKAK